MPLSEVVVRTIHLFVELHYDILEERGKLELHFGFWLGASLRRGG